MKEKESLFIFGGDWHLGDNHVIKWGQYALFSLKSRQLQREEKPICLQVNKLYIL